MFGSNMLGVKSDILVSNGGVGFQDQTLTGHGMGILMLKVKFMMGFI